MKLDANIGPVEVQSLILKTLILRNFRGYQDEIRIPFEDSITSFVGKNDVGKSTILEALDSFFNGDTRKVTAEDLNICSGDKTIVIGCEFTGSPEQVIIDARTETSLETEFLLNKDGNLEIHAVYDFEARSAKPTFHAYAYHPSASLYDDLLALKIAQLKGRLKDLDIPESEIDLRSCSKIRKALWNHCSDLSLKMTLIPLNKDDMKAIWDELRRYLPTYALFQADRASTDSDPEVQDPMKIAIREALKMVEADLDKIKSKVQEEATSVAERTLDKLRDMDPGLANELTPIFQAEPKWDTIFKLSLEGDNNIPINKRGSGVRRLILLNFFRAQAEKKMEEAETPSIIYAIEEPETSQHPSNQKMLIEALLGLSGREGCQTVITTHVPALAGLLPTRSLRLVCETAEGAKRIEYGQEPVYTRIASELGVLPDNRVQLLVCVEGPHDVSFLRNISKVFRAADPLIPDLIDDPKIALIPLGGDNLKQWVHQHYLKNLRLPEIHIYDGDKKDFAEICAIVNARADGSWATQTSKREMENYIHPQAINDHFSINIDFGDSDDVPKIIETALAETQASRSSKGTKTIKRILNNEVAAAMSAEQIREIDHNGEITEWLEKIASFMG